MFKTKFHENKLINGRFWKKIEGGGAENLNFFRKFRLFLKIEDFQSSLMILEPDCKIWKSLKNGKLVLQLLKIGLLRTGVFLRIWDLKLHFAQNLWIFTRNHNFIYIIWCNNKLSIIWNLFDQNLFRIERENGISLVFSRKEENKVGDNLGAPSFIPKINYHLKNR